MSKKVAKMLVAVMMVATVALTVGCAQQAPEM